MGHDHLKENSIPKAYRRDLKVNIIIQYVPVVTWISHPSDAAFAFSTKLLMASLRERYHDYLQLVYRIMEQCLNQMPEGEIQTDDAKCCPPTRHEMKVCFER